MTSLLRFEAANWRPVAATRCALGIAIPVIAAHYANHPAWGVLASLGALYVGLSAFNGVYQARLLLMFQVTLVLALMTLLGSLVSDRPALAIAVVAAVAFVLSLFAVRGPSAAAVASLGTGVLVVLSGIPASAANPWGNAGLVAAGGLVQIALLSVVGRVAPLYQERRALSLVYAGLADFVAALGHEGERPIPDTARLQEARDRMDEAQRFRWRPEHARLLQALRSAEAMRAALVGFGRADAKLRLLGVEGIGRASVTASALEEDLRKLGEALRKGDDLGHAPHLPRVQDCDYCPEHAKWTELVETILHELRETPPERPAPKKREKQPWLPSASLRDLSTQHALRYALIVALADALGRWWHIPHGYWLPLTVAMILRTDYSGTLTRALGRLLGTVVGVLAASVLISAIHPASIALSVLMIAAAWLAWALFLTNYAAFTTSVTLYVVFSIAASGVGDRSAVTERLLATLAGVVIAVVGNYVWPIWQSRKVAQVLRDALEAQCHYGKGLLNLVSTGDAAEAEERRPDARTLRLEAEKVVQAAQLEPSWGRRHVPSGAEEILERLDENAAILLVLHAEALQRGPLGDEAIRTAQEVLEADRELVARISPS